MRGGAFTATPVPPWGLAVGAMVSVQLASALSVQLIPSVGAAGVGWLRLSAGAVLFLVLGRPPFRAVRRHDLPRLLGLGATMGLQNIVFLAAIGRIPLGTAVAVELLGPLTVAAMRSRSRRSLAWLTLALTGVALVTEPWLGDINLAGVTFAALAAIGWGTYVVLTQRIGDRFSGIKGLSLTVPVAAATAAIVGVPQAANHLSASILLEAAGLGVLLPVLPFTFEMLALRRMTLGAFGTLMAVEPAVAVLLGLALLHQAPSAIQLAGVLLVVVAGAAAQRGGTRRGRDDGPLDAPPASSAPPAPICSPPTSAGSTSAVAEHAAGLAALRHSLDEIARCPDRLLWALSYGFRPEIRHPNLSRHGRRMARVVARARLVANDPTLSVGEPGKCWTLHRHVRRRVGTPTPSPSDSAPEGCPANAYGARSWGARTFP